MMKDKVVVTGINMISSLGLGYGSKLGETNPGPKRDT